MINKINKIIIFAKLLNTFVVLLLWECGDVVHCRGLFPVSCDWW